VKHQRRATIKDDDRLEALRGPKRVRVWCNLLLPHPLL